MNNFFTDENRLYDAWRKYNELSMIRSTRKAIQELIDNSEYMEEVMFFAMVGLNNYNTTFNKLMKKEMDEKQLKFDFGDKKN